FKIIQENIDRYRQTLKLEQIILSRPESLNPLLTTPNINEIKNKLKERAIQFQVIDQKNQKSKWFFLSHLMSYFIQVGIPANTLYLLLVFPFLTAMVVVAKQWIGLSAFGVYLPIMLALSFFVLGSEVGLMVIGLVIVMSILIRSWFEHFHLLYTPRIALALSLIALSFLGVILLILKTKISINIPAIIFPMLLTSTLSEKFISVQGQEGIKSALFETISTIGIALVAYYLMNISIIQDLIISLPELILIPFALILFFGRFSGLRISEYFRFRSLLKENQEE
ncbi:MAG TPA: 7TM domain-containing protein, partial [Candidatus Gracilibacteria bacterium]|nr:7TM domain-containing protein [Candidatus Gracilibacteria bacterium]